MNPTALLPTGAAMDRPLPRPAAAWRWLVAALGVLAAAGLAWSWRAQWPQAPLLANAQLAPARQALFRDELPLRGRAEPLRSLLLDAQDSGRIVEVFARDGQWVDAGAPLYRLHSPEQEQQRLQRAAEVAQQLANVSLQRTALATSQALGRRELAQLAHDEARAQQELQRQRRLAEAGFVSAAALDDAERRQALATQLLQQARRDLDADALTRQQSLAEMAQAVRGLQQGLALLDRARQAWLARAPIAGRLAGFTPQPGASLRVGERLGRLDDERSGTQLVAELDEFYLPRLRDGLPAASALGALTLVQTLPQVQGGKVRAVLRWQGEPPAQLRPGQAVDLRLRLGAERPALLLPEGPGVQSTLYVLQDQALVRRSVRLGARAAGQVEVLAGLQAGEQVLISEPPHFNAQAYRLR